MTDTRTTITTTGNLVVVTCWCGIQHGIPSSLSDWASASTDHAVYSCGRSFETPRGLSIHQGHSRGPNWALPTTSRWSAHLTTATP